MLKWWLPHHIELFDNGILINHCSTDGSADTCRSVAPHWQLVNTRLTDFNTLENDLEVMKYEAAVDGWKMALNATEFLVCSQNKLNKTLRNLKAEKKSCLQTRGVIMVDDQPKQIAVKQKPLVQQKCYGYIEDEFPYDGQKFSSIRSLYYNYQIKFSKCRSRVGVRNRIIHSHVTGDYGPGRHATKHKIEAIFEPLYTFWYGFSPWDQEMILRKQQFKNRIPKEDIKKKAGYQHLWEEPKLQEEYKKHLTRSRDLGGLLT